MLQRFVSGAKLDRVEAADGVWGIGGRAVEVDGVEDDCCNNGVYQI